MNFFYFFFEFSNSGRIETVRARKFMFLYFSAYTDLFLLKMKPEWCFLIFWIFLLFFFEFSNLVRVGTDRNNFFFPLFFGLSHPVSVWNGARMMFFNFLNFFTIFFSNSGWVGTDRIKIFFSLFFGRNGLEQKNIFLYFLACPNPFRLEMKPGWFILIFWIFLLLFMNFLTRVG